MSDSWGIRCIGRCVTASENVADVHNMHLSNDYHACFPHCGKISATFTATCIA